VQGEAEGVLWESSREVDQYTETLLCHA
jgi:hypothetical protein